MRRRRGRVVLVSLINFKKILFKSSLKNLDKKKLRKMSRVMRKSIAIFLVKMYLLFLNPKKKRKFLNQL